MGHSSWQRVAKKSKGPKRGKARHQTRRRALKGRKAAPAVIPIKNRRVREKFNVTEAS